MNVCKICGRRIKSQYEYCFACNQKKLERDEYARYRSMTEEEKELEREQYYNTECDMCGKEGASRRADGRNYCSMCWQVWNS